MANKPNLENTKDPVKADYILAWVGTRRKITTTEIHEELGFEPDTDEFDRILSLLSKHDVKIIEDDDIDDELDSDDNSEQVTESEEDSDSEDENTDDNKTNDDASDDAKVNEAIAKYASDDEFAGVDPVRMYLTEMGKISLLSRDQEIAISKRMEEGQAAILTAALNCPIMVSNLFKMIEEVEKGERRSETIVECLEVIENASVSSSKNIAIKAEQEELNKDNSDDDENISLDLIDEDS